MSQYFRAAVVLSGLLVAGAGTAEETPLSVTWSAGIETSRGDFGGDVDIEDIYVPVKLTVEGRRVALSVTVPYLRVTAPVGTTVIDPGGTPVPGSGEIVTDGGLGDVVAGLTIYDVYYNPDLGLALDVTGKVKFGTADADKGLGTGETDFTLIADLVKFLDSTALIGSVGYKFRGEPDGYELNDAMVASLGAIFETGNDAHRVGLFLDYRESSIVGEDAVTELSVSFARRMKNERTVQFFVATGFGDSTPDWAAGFLFYSG